MKLKEHMNRCEDCCRTVYRWLLNLLWDPQLKSSRAYLDAKARGEKFSAEYLTQEGQADLEEVTASIEFILSRAEKELNQSEKSAESLSKKCAELLKLNSALIVAVFALIRYFREDSSDMYLTVGSVFFLLGAIALAWGALAGLPHLPPTSSMLLSEWERKGDKTSRLKYLTAIQMHRASVANEHVNTWVATRLKLGWVTTLLALVLLFAELVTQIFEDLAGYSFFSHILCDILRHLS